MLALLLESALRLLALGGVVWLGLKLFRVRNPHAQMTAWTVVLLASLSMPVFMINEFSPMKHQPASSKRQRSSPITSM